MTPIFRARARGSVRAVASWSAMLIDVRSVSDRPDPAARVCALGDERELSAPRAHRLAGQRLAVRVTLGSVDDVEPGIERAAEQSLDRANRHPVVADLRAAEAQHAGDHAGPTKAAPLH